MLIIDPLIKIMKARVGERAEILYYMDDMKVSTTDIQIAQVVHGIVKEFAMSIGMMINSKKSAI